ncbi:MAG TPA: hypothetical protein VMW47_06680 [Verrucomicrobiae bacterium]|nr:hypothetical protein [Verrucomicrobiae bacterium]
MDGLRGPYRLPGGDGRLVAEATREGDAGLVPELTAGGMAEVLGECLRLAPPLAAATVREWRVGPGPVSPDGRCWAWFPVSAAAISSAGTVPAGSSSARLPAGVVAGSNPDPALGPYRPARFGTGPAPR